MACLPVLKTVKGLKACKGSTPLPSLMGRLTEWQCAGLLNQGRGNSRVGSIPASSAKNYKGVKWVRLGRKTLRSTIKDPGSIPGTSTIRGSMI